MEFALFSVLLNAFSIAKPPNYWLSFFYCLLVCILCTTFICVVWISLLVYLSAFFNFGFIYAIVCLPYFLQRFCALRVCFFGENNSCLSLFFFLQVLVRCASSFWANFFRFQSLFFLFQILIYLSFVCLHWWCLAARFFLFFPLVSHAVCFA